VIDAADPLTVLVGPTAYYDLNDIVSISAGSEASYTVTRYDQYDNLVVSGAETVYLYSSSDGANKDFRATSGGGAISSVVITDASSSKGFFYYDEKAGDWTITASDNATAPDGATGITDGTDVLTVIPDVTSYYTLNDVVSITAGTEASYTVSRYDQYDNPVTSGNETVYLYSDSTGADK